MAIIYGKNTAVDYAAGNLASFGKSYSRMGAAPLDMYEVWYDYDKLVEYASFRGNDANGKPVYDGNTEVVDTSAVTSYVGQKVAYVNEAEGKIYHYSIELNGTLKEIGTSPIGDDKSIVVATDGTVSLKGVGTLVFEKDVLGEDGEPTGKKEEVKYQPLMTKAGLTWVEPSKTTVEGLATLIEDLTARVKELEDDRVTTEEFGALEDKVDAFLTGTGATDALDSLQELIEYISSHDDTDIAGILESIQAVENKLTGIDSTVTAYVAAAIEALKIGEYAKASDLTNVATRVKNLEDAGYAVAADVARDYATKEYVGSFTTGEDDYKDISSIVGYINKKAEETLAAAQGGSSETAASVALALQNYKNENDPKVQKNANDIVALTGQLSTTDGNVTNILTRLGALEIEVGVEEKSRIDVLEGVLNGAGGTEGLVAIVTGHGTRIGTLESADVRIEKKADDNAAAVLALQNKVDTGDKTVSAYVADALATIKPYDDTAVKALITAETERATGIEGGLRTDVNANTAAIALLNNTADTEGSVKHTVATELAKIISDDDADIDTLNEIAAWIINDTTGAAKMANDIAALNTKVDITGKVSDYVAGEIAKIPAYDLPAATKDAFGGVRLSDEIGTNDDGQLEVKTLSTDKLVNGSMELVLNGGNANGKASA